VTGVGADGPGDKFGHLRMQAPPWQEYGKLTYAGAGTASSAYGRGKRTAAAKPQVRQLKIGPVSSVGRASPW
jgi:hypothetical protein